MPAKDKCVICGGKADLWDDHTPFCNKCYADEKEMAKEERLKLDVSKL